VLYLRFTGHGSGLFPEVDWIRPRGMDLWPGLLNAAGALMLFAGMRGAMGGVRPVRDRIVVCLGSVLVIGYWLFPQHFMVDRLSPPTVGGDTIPVVIDGTFDHRRWERRGEPGLPLLQFGNIMANEGRLSAMAHGIGHAGAQLNPEGLDATTLRRQGRVRSTLWAVQRVVAPVVTVAGLAVLVLAGVCLIQVVRARGLPGDSPRRAATLVLAVLLIPPVTNVMMRVVGLGFGLPEAMGGTGGAVLHAGMTAGSIALAGLAARCWSSASGGEE